MSLATRIAALRRKKRESLNDVAQAVGVSKAHIWQLERGEASNPSMALVRRLADHFGVTVASLAGEDIDAPDTDPELARMFRQASELDPQDRDVIDDMIQSFLKRRKAKAGDAGA
ncbi:helix-turn-helix domain-containing protein [Minwuia thermotolerans]|uniref:XRE family transcriptional regulator n=1 Tax=Minwuia thermotolerans TaxID=2056226 RepID=A0A2M9G568_9PROT|nr:helix-turn-helix transcriptional regulator [Minwuia thermotolerans]PJK30852.1 XRE family transcriptional regulator [Minwuia thermotolerans]